MAVTLGVRCTLSGQSTASSGGGLVGGVSEGVSEGVSGGMGVQSVV